MYYRVGHDFNRDSPRWFERSRDVTAVASVHPKKSSIKKRRGGGLRCNNVILRPCFCNTRTSVQEFSLL